MAENKGYMQYAMLFGTYLGGYWILKFILFPLGLTIPFLSFLFVGIDNETMIDETEINVVCHCRQQCGKHIHEYCEYPCMQEADTAAAYSITIHSYIIIAHERDT